MNVENIIEQNRNLIQQVIRRPFKYKSIISYSREDFLNQVEEREEAEYLEKVYGVKNKFLNELSIPKKINC
jgi:hypothetical protein